MSHWNGMQMLEAYLLLHLSHPRIHRPPNRSTGRRSTTNCRFDEPLGRHADARSLPVARHLSHPRIHRPPKPPSYPRRLTRSGGRPYVRDPGGIEVSSEVVQAGSRSVELNIVSRVSATNRGSCNPDGMSDINGLLVTFSSDGSWSGPQGR
jgi:hypothetical protein